MTSQTEREVKRLLSPEYSYPDDIPGLEAEAEIVAAALASQKYELSLFGPATLKKGDLAEVDELNNVQTNIAGLHKVRDNIEDRLTRARAVVTEKEQAPDPAPRKAPKPRQRGSGKRKSRTPSEVESENDAQSDGVGKEADRDAPGEAGENEEDEEDELDDERASPQPTPRKSQRQRRQKKTTSASDLSSSATPAPASTSATPWESLKAFTRRPSGAYLVTPIEVGQACARCRENELTCELRRALPGEGQRTPTACDACFVAHMPCRELSLKCRYRIQGTRQEVRKVTAGKSGTGGDGPPAAKKRRTGAAKASDQEREESIHARLDSIAENIETIGLDLKRVVSDLAKGHSALMKEVKSRR